MDKLHGILVSSGLDAKYTFRMMGGYFDTDSTFWDEPSGYVPTAPTPLKRGFGFLWWSWVDRLNRRFSYFPSYTPAPRENPPLSTCKPGTEYYIDASLRDENHAPYSTFSDFMGIARKLDPIFLMLHQFNEFSLGDEGWDANSTDDIEGADYGIGRSAVEAVREQIRLYRKSVGP